MYANTRKPNPLKDYQYPPAPQRAFQSQYKPTPLSEDPLIRTLFAMMLFTSGWAALLDFDLAPHPQKVYKSISETIFGDPNNFDMKNDSSKAHPHITPKEFVYMDIDIDGEAAGRIVIGLYSDFVPRTAENFKQLAVGVESELSTRGVLSYDKTPFHRVVRNFCVQGGDVLYGTGQAGYSIYGRHFEDEKFGLTHDCAGTVSMSNSGKDKNASQFFILTNPSPHLDKKHVIFGRVVQGMSVLHKIDKLCGSWNGEPKGKASVVKCGIESDFQLKTADE